MTEQVDDADLARAVDLDVLQSEQVAWSKRNFGAQPAYRPLLGLIEELCELDEACNEENEEATLDALGDVGIYMLDYCGKRGWQIKELWDAKAPLNEEIEGQVDSGFLDVIPLIKRLAHHQLKGEQNIRGGSAHHDDELKITLRAILWMMDAAAAAMTYEFLLIMDKIWQKVRLRDWTKNPNTAHAVAEAEASGG